MTRQSAVNLIAHYSKVNNLANRSDDAHVLDTVEDGPLYAMSVGGYKQDSGTPAKKRKPYEPFSYDTSTAQLYIPTFRPGAERWFAAGVTITGTDRHRLLVFAEQRDHSWQMVCVVDLDSAAFPPVALDRKGNATAVTADAERLRLAVIDDFATGGRQDGRYLTASPASRRQTGIHAKDSRSLGSKGTVTFAAAQNPWQTAYGLKLADGSVLVLFAHTHTQTDALHLGWEYHPDPDVRGWLGTGPMQSISYTFTCNDAASVPPRGKATLLGYTCEMTGADGTPVGFPLTT
jgi:hypothetical protein